VTEESAFAAAVRERHGIAPREIVRRPELDGGGFLGFTAVADGGNVRGLASSARVLTYADPDAFGEWLAAVDFARWAAADPVQLVHVYRSLQPPPATPHPEDAFPLLYAQQLETAPTAAPDGRPNVLWWLFTSGDRAGEQRRATGRAALARFRAEHARRLGDRDFDVLLKALHGASADFRAEWARHEVLTEQLGTKTIDHPRLGPVRLHHLQSAPTSHPDLRLTQMVPADDATRAALAGLA
jgi:hypothetical protein